MQFAKIFDNAEEVVKNSPVGRRRTISANKPNGSDAAPAVVEAEQPQQQQQQPQRTPVKRTAMAGQQKTPSKAPGSSRRPVLRKSQTARVRSSAAARPRQARSSLVGSSSSGSSSSSTGGRQRAGGSMNRNGDKPVLRRVKSGSAAMSTAAAVAAKKKALLSPTTGTGSLRESKDESVHVVVRCRPFIGDEDKLNDGARAVSCFTEHGRVEAEHKGKGKAFTFDTVYGEDSTQEELYTQSVQPLVETCFDGFNGTVFAYGQTSSGKTHTMMGGLNDPVHMGVIPRVVTSMFDRIKETGVPTGAEPCAENEGKFHYLLLASFLQIYNEKVQDLLVSPGSKQNSGKGLEVREDPDKGFFVPAMTKHLVNDKDALLRLIQKGCDNRTTAATTQNETSSRSHSLLILQLEKQAVGTDHVVQSKVNLVDLAGSERLQTSSNAASKETVAINQSLSSLSNVISALTDPKKRGDRHVPYRASKLTMLLKDSLGGNTKTLMVACVNPGKHNGHESLSTLRYASRAKKITNKPVINEDPKDAMLRSMVQEIEHLRMLLTQKQAHGNVMDSGGHSYFGNAEERLSALQGSIIVSKAVHNCASKWIMKALGRGLVNDRLSLKKLSTAIMQGSLLTPATLKRLLKSYKNDNMELRAQHKAQEEELGKLRQQQQQQHPAQSESQSQQPPGENGSSSSSSSSQTTGDTKGGVGTDHNKVCSLNSQLRVARTELIQSKELCNTLRSEMETLIATMVPPETQAQTAARKDTEPSSATNSTAAAAAASNSDADAADRIAALREQVRLLTEQERKRASEMAALRADAQRLTQEGQHRDGMIERLFVLLRDSRTLEPVAMEGTPAMPFRSIAGRPAANTPDSLNVPARQ